MADPLESALREALERAVPFGSAPDDRWHRVRSRVRRRRRGRWAGATIAGAAALSVGVLGVLGVRLPGTGQIQQQAASRYAAPVDHGTKTVTLPVSAFGRLSLTMSVPASWNWLSVGTGAGAADLVLSSQPLTTPSAQCGAFYFCAVTEQRDSGLALKEDSFVLSTLVKQGAYVLPGPTAIPTQRPCQSVGGGAEQEYAVSDATLVVIFQICERDLTAPTAGLLDTALASAHIITSPADQATVMDTPTPHTTATTAQ